MNRQRLALILAAGIPVFAVFAQDNGNPDDTTVLYHGLTERKRPEINEIIPGLRLGALIEIEAEHVNQAGNDTSDAKVATLEFGIDFQPVAWAEGHVLFAWDEAESDQVEVDEATITLGKTEDIPFFITAGRHYLPFGVFNTHFISDPLVQTLGETRQTTVICGYESDILQAVIGVFRGCRTSQEKINNTVASLSFTPHDDIEFGLYAISDCGESLTLLDETLDDLEDYEKTPGIGAYASLSAWLLHLDAECLGAVKTFQAGTFVENEETKPWAWNLELSMQPIQRIELAARIEGAHDLVPEAAKRRFGGVITFGIIEHLTLSIEYLHTHFQDDSKDANAIRAQLAARF